MLPESVSADDPDDPWWGDEEDWEEEYDYAEVLTDCLEAAEDRAHAAQAAARTGTTAALAALAAAAGRRGPGQPGSAKVFPGEYSGPAAQFASGMLFDVMPGSSELAKFADQAAGEDDAFKDVSDDEVLGVLCAWDRVAAHATARKYAAAAELIRRRPAAGWPVDKKTRMPQVWDEFTPSELCAVLAESKGGAAGILGLAHDLEVKLPGTKAAFLDGIVSEEKAWIIARATAVLNADEARAAEALVLDRAGQLTPGALRAAIARAVTEVAPDKARKRREHAARDARVERWAEDSGNAALMGRELPPDEVLAADQRITARARELKKAGLEGGMDELRARAYLDLLLGKDSRPHRDGAEPAANPPAAAAPGGFAGRLTLTVPLTTLARLADRPGELAGLGPIDPWLARDLAAAAAQNPNTTWCLTVTDQHGHAVGHGCARPEPENHRKRAGPGKRDGPGFTFTRASRDVPPGGYGTWILRTPGNGPDLRVTLDPLTTQDCDHRYQASGHDPGIKLRHLAEVRHATCTGIACRRPSVQADFEHNTPYEAGGRTCLCNGGPKCRQDHRLKQHPKWKVDQLPDGTFRWTTPSGRSCTTEPTRYPI